MKKLLIAGLSLMLYTIHSADLDYVKKQANGITTIQTYVLGDRTIITLTGHNKLVEISINEQRNNASIKENGDDTFRKLSVYKVILILDKVATEEKARNIRALRKNIFSNMPPDDQNKYNTALVNANL